MVGSLVFVVLSPQLEHDVALRTFPANILVFNSKMHRVLVSDHIPFLPEGFLT